MIKLIDDNDSDLQRLNELERKKLAITEKVSKKENKAKILLGEFLIDMLEKKSVAGLNDYVANNFENSLNADDKKSLKSVIDNLKNSANKTSETVNNI